MINLSSPYPYYLSKFRVLLIALGFILFLSGAIFILKQMGIQLLYQSTQSMPTGLYLQYPANNYELKDNVVFYPNLKMESLILKRGWLNIKEPLLKRIIAVNGNYVCIKDHMLWVNNKKIAPILAHDRKGKTLPYISFCRNLVKNEFWVLGVSSPYSFDSRYFGVVMKSQIKGKALYL